MEHSPAEVLVQKGREGVKPTQVLNSDVIIRLQNLSPPEIEKVVREHKIEKLKETISMLSKEKAKSARFQNIQNGDSLIFNCQLCFTFI